MSVNIDEVYGSIKISDEVIASTAAIAATQVEGVAELTGGISESISNIIGKSTLAKGIKVNVNEDNVLIDIYIIVNYGVKIPEVAWNVQESVKKEIEKITGITVQAINIHVQGVEFNNKIDDKDPAKEPVTQKKKKVEIDL
ncbi:MAG: Asp23/Gls24 family envelope stress response protein [Clostridiales bacterium]|nr:Asp23/Gls24 family envelope stress response protein [Clostridiales bacterium]